MFSLFILPRVFSFYGYYIILFKQEPYHFFKNHNAAVALFFSFSALYVCIKKEQVL